MQSFKTFTEFTIKVKDEASIDLVLAILSGYPFDAFQEVDNNTLVAAMKTRHLTKDLEQEMMSSISGWIEKIEKSIIEDTNWNNEWEQNFDAIEIGDLCRIYAPFHSDKFGFKYSLKVQPRMAFGTGHHETTRMMIRMMDTISLNDKHVLDFGCGTGILALVASRMGAATVLGIDVESWAIENSDENAELNNIQNTHFSGRTIQKCVDEAMVFDIILANIQLDVLSTYKEQIKVLLQPETGMVILSGVLQEFQSKLEKTYADTGFVLQNTMQEGKWICQLYTLA